MNPTPDPLKNLFVSPTIRPAALWKIERTDAVTYRFTDHDQEIVFEGATYTPRGSFNSSARQKLSNMKVRNLEIVGFISDDAITHEDLRAGKWRDAKITEYLVDWLYPFAGSLYTNTYWLAEVSFTGEGWVAQVQGVSRRLNQSVGRTIGRLCDHTLGDDRCDVDLGVLTVSSTVAASGVIVPRSVFKTGLTAATHYFKYGYLTWTSGLNSGQKSEVRNYSNTDGVVQLALRTPFNIADGDGFNIVPGCDKTAATCRIKFSNLSRFGGFPFVPGSDRMFTTPDRK